MFAFIALPSFLAGQGLGLGLGFIAGVFTPGILRKIRGVFDKAKSDVVGAVKSVEGDAKKVAGDIEKKL